MDLNVDDEHNYVGYDVTSLQRFSH
jgi:hypothetical protein